MKPIDFEKHLNEFVMQWIKAHKQLVEGKQFDDFIVDIYCQWESAPASWLSGQAPKEYFHNIKEPGSLIEMVRDYIREDMEIPYLLVHRVEHVAKQAEDLLIDMLHGDSKEAVFAIGFLNEIGSDKVIDDYIRIIAAQQEPPELVEAAVSGLKDMKLKNFDVIISEFDRTGNGRVRDCFADILSCTGEPAVFERLLKEFQSERDTAMYASFLGRLGDERALPYLQSMIRRTDITYYEYETLRNAINELGEDTIEREFYGDKDYELLRGAE